ncbi:phosphonate C-P lyase system protein PhnH [Roseibacterium sp. SDUM158016]|uniref:phosphonate C-P lyase system protein PhnH n=1 Tax=Roseicyclus sediminis TaxID=2980997 RepID=UPI0021D11A69|nr:phosphonate C-P lyase system protein PhnH [Roseibacterium sp. SDUM158016]MCU4653423.1 phosphonate C-P lyase system protein PhnH [Roseibacterium sp. SDUM158016]
MSLSALDGGFADPPVEAAHAFRAVLQALSRPGRIERIAGAAPPSPCSPAAGAVLMTLCDPTTPLFLAPSHDTDDVRAWIAFHTAAPLCGPETAQFALGTWGALQPVGRFSVGTSEYPDRSATLIVEVETLAAGGARLTGPGIETEAALSLPEVDAFRVNRARFPLGFDCLFTCGDRVAGLPRSTIVAEG